MRRSKAQLGCLTALLLFVCLGFAVEYLGTREPPGSDEGGGPIAALAILGLVVFVVGFAANGLIRKVTGRDRQVPPGE